MALWAFKVPACLHGASVGPSGPSRFWVRALRRVYLVTLAIKFAELSNKRGSLCPGFVDKLLGLADYACLSFFHYFSGDYKVNSPGS
jgi:hypothetical protein